jgi:PII-like signaling protein
MKIEGEGQLLRIFIGESDRWEGGPLSEAIVRKARAEGLAGATVLRGLMGFGADSRMHTAKVLRLSEDLPLVIEIVDKPEKIAAFLPGLDAMVDEGMITLEKVHIIAYRHSRTGGTS